MTENKVAIKGRVLSIDENSGVSNGREWRRFDVILGDVLRAGKKKDEVGKVSYSTFDKPEFSVGAVVGQAFRVRGYEYNRDGKPAVGVSLAAEGAPKVLEEAPAGGKAEVSEEEFPWN